MHRDGISRLKDEIAVLEVERRVSETYSSRMTGDDSSFCSRSKGVKSSRAVNNVREVDDFDVSTSPIHDHPIIRLANQPSTSVARFIKKVNGSSFLVRYFAYIMPLTCLLLIPIFCGMFIKRETHIGGVDLEWFCVWLEILWLALWGARIVIKALPWMMGFFASIFTSESNIWKDMGRQLEMPLTLFLWWLAVEISFLPTMRTHTLPHYRGDKGWQGTVNKIVVSILVGFSLNLGEKIFIQLVAMSFHLRTYADRIEIARFQIGSLVKMYKYSREMIDEEDHEFEDNEKTESGPSDLVAATHKNLCSVLRKAKDFGAKVAEDFTGRHVAKTTDPLKVVLTLLRDASGSRVLARRLYRTFARRDMEVVEPSDLNVAFENGEQATAAFSMFDKDMNHDITMEEFEAVCVEIGRERKGIMASLKDLDSVITRLDWVLMCIVTIITLLVLITLLSASAAGVLASLGGSVLALSWLFAATAQEFLQSIVFVFIKHPFDIGDRITIYGNAGAELKGDDYFVKKISLLYTEFKKMEGQVVQAPNSYLNTLFILNMRRSGGLAEPIHLTVKFSTPVEQIDILRARLLGFVETEKREFQPKILTEVYQVNGTYSLGLRVVIFYKSNWQNELLRLQRRNKFICALVIIMREIGFEGPNSSAPSQNPDNRFCTSVRSDDTSCGSTDSVRISGNLRQTSISSARLSNEHEKAPSGPTAATEATSSRDRHDSCTDRAGAGRVHAESVCDLAKRVDFSLGLKDMAPTNPLADVYDDDRANVAARARTASIALSSSADIGISARARRSEPCRVDGESREKNKSSATSERRPDVRFDEPETEKPHETGKSVDAEAAGDEAKIFKGKQRLERQGVESKIERGGA